MQDTGCCRPVHQHHRRRRHAVRQTPGLADGGRAQRRFQRCLPARFHLQDGEQVRRVSQPFPGQPVGQSGARQRGVDLPLQGAGFGFVAGQLVAQGGALLFVLLAGLIQRREGGFLFSRLLAGGQQGGGGRFAGGNGGRQFAGGRQVQHGGFVGQPAPPFGQCAQGAGAMLGLLPGEVAPAGQFGQPVGQAGKLLVQLPETEFGVRQAVVAAFAGKCGVLGQQFGFGLAFVPVGQLFADLVGLGRQGHLLGTGGVAVALDTGGVVLDVAGLFFQPGHVGADAGQMLLAAVDLLVGGEMRFAGFFDGCVQFSAAPGQHGQFGFQPGQFGLRAGFAFLGFALFHQCQQVLLLRQLLAHGLVLAGDFGLSGQPVDLAGEFFADVVQARQVVAGVVQARLGFAPAFLVFGHAGGFFEVMAQLFGLGFDDARNHALLDHGVALGADTGTEKEVGNVAPAHLLAVDPVAGIPLAGKHALDGDFAVLAPGAGGTAFAVVEHQFDRCAAGGLASGGAVENHVLH